MLATSTAGYPSRMISGAASSRSYPRACVSNTRRDRYDSRSSSAEPFGEFHANSLK